MTFWAPSFASPWAVQLVLKGVRALPARLFLFGILCSASLRPAFRLLCPFACGLSRRLLLLPLSLLLLLLLLLWPMLPLIALAEVLFLVSFLAKGRRLNAGR